MFVYILRERMCRPFDYWDRRFDIRLLFLYGFLWPHKLPILIPRPPTFHSISKTRLAPAPVTQLLALPLAPPSTLTLRTDHQVPFDLCLVSLIVQHSIIPAVQRIVVIGIVQFHFDRQLFAIHVWRDVWHSPRKRVAAHEQAAFVLMQDVCNAIYHRPTEKQSVYELIGVINAEGGVVRVVDV